MKVRFVVAQKRRMLAPAQDGEWTAVGDWGGPHVFEGRRAAEAFVASLEAGQYELSHGEAARPEYRILRADSNQGMAAIRRFLL